MTVWQIFAILEPEQLAIVDETTTSNSKSE